MSPEQNKDIARRFYDSLNKGNLNIIDDLLTNDFIEHELLPIPVHGREGVKQFFTSFASAFPDGRFSPEAIYAEGDTVIALIKVRGTQQGELPGIPMVTGKPMDINAIDIFRFVDGKIAEHWGVADNLGMLQQLGVIPAPGQPG